jgi:predicted ATPase
MWCAKRAVTLSDAQGMFSHFVEALGRTCDVVPLVSATDYRCELAECSVSMPADFAYDPAAKAILEAAFDADAAVTTVTADDTTTCRSLCGPWVNIMLSTNLIRCRKYSI